ncbi:MAG: ATP/GTP-binding protein [Verrucomicrobia bacterium]|nr:ATP/GTP-binding protein [Verrucomicrobiota bacterium]
MDFAPLKVVVSGPVGAGKSTYIRTLSTTTVVETDEMATECIGKDLTTVALDFGTLHIDGFEVLLFGTPGQERFDFMWSVLCEGAAGLLLLVAAHRPGSFLKARHILEFITSQVPIPFLLAVTHTDQERVWELEEIADFFGLPVTDLLAVDARDRSACARMLHRLLERCLPTGRDEQSRVTA